MSNTTEEYWDVDGVSLQTLAWNIRTWGGSRQGAPSMRGDDVVLPGVDGRFRVEKEPESRTVDIVGWVIGTDEDGTVVDAQRFRENWRHLLRLLFNQGRPVALTRRWMEPRPVERRRNLATNSEPVGALGATPAGWRQAVAAENQMQVVSVDGHTAIQVSRGPGSYYIDPAGPGPNLRFVTKAGDRWRLRTEIKVLKPIAMRLIIGGYNAAAASAGQVVNLSRVVWPSDGWQTYDAMGEVTVATTETVRLLIWPHDGGVPINLAPNRDFVDDANVSTSFVSKAIDATTSSSPGSSLRLTVLPDATSGGTYVEERAIPCTPNRWVGLGVDVAVQSGSRWFSPRIAFLDVNNTVLAWGALDYREVQTPDGQFERRVTALQAPAGTTTARVYLYARGSATDAPAAGSVFNTDSWNAVVTVTQADALFQAGEFIPTPIGGPAYLVRRVLAEQSVDGKPFEGTYFYGGSPADGDLTYGYEGAAGASPSIEYEPRLQAVSATASGELVDGLEPTSTGPQRATFNAGVALADPWFYGVAETITLKGGVSGSYVVPGDRKTSEVLVDLVGPLTTPALTVNGVVLRYATVPAGTTARVDVREFSAVETSGSTTTRTLAKVIGSTAGPWVSLKPGPNQISLAATGAGEVRITYRPKWL